MRPVGPGEGGHGVELMPDVSGGWFIGRVGGDFIAATTMRITGRALARAGVTTESLNSGEHSLDQFLIPGDERDGAYRVADGVEASFKEPFDPQYRAVSSPNVLEVWPAVSERAVDATVVGDPTSSNTM